MAFHRIGILVDGARIFTRGLLYITLKEQFVRALHERIYINLLIH
jgi:hypothetical protein